MDEREQPVPSSEMADTLPQHRDETPSSTPRSPKSDDSADLTGKLLAARYRVIERLGAGGMGTVYRAEHVDIHKPVAIKALNAELQSRPESVERFLQEARTASRIGHAHVVEITDFGRTDDDAPFFAMELLDGEDLRTTIEREGPLPWPRVRHILLQVLDALEAAHACGVIHRDMKPANCFRITRGGDSDFIKVLDFGLAKILGDHPDYQSLSGTGSILGTPNYMSPEQARSERLDPRTDVYSAGVVAFELLTGKAPFHASGFVGVLSKLLTDPTPSLDEVAPGIEVPAGVEAIVHRAMTKDRSERYQSAAAFAAALRAIPETASAVKPVAGGLRPRALVGAVLGCVVLGLAGLWVAFGDDQDSAPRVDEPHVAAAPTVAPIPAPESTPSSPPTEREPTPSSLQAPPPLEILPSQPPLPEPKPPPMPKPGPKPPMPKQPAATDEPPETLSRDQMKHAIAAAEQAAIACGQKHGSILSTVKVKFEVRPDGEVADAWALAPMKGTPVGTCAAEAIATQRFPASRDGVTDTVTLPLR